jgi:4-hydroxy-3-polyprenylbenzoate decarboxylase
MRAAAVWQALNKAGVPGVTGVWDTETGGGRMWLVTAIKQMYPGHASQAAAIASFSYQGNVLNKWTIVVDDDIDPTDFDQVNWAMCSRCCPAEDIDIIRASTTTPLDPALRPELKRNGIIENSRAIIRATKPYDRIIRGDFPPVVWWTPEFEQEVREKWGHLGIF